MIRGTNFIGCISTDHYHTAILTWPDTKEKYRIIRQPGGIILGERI